MMIKAKRKWKLKTDDDVEENEERAKQPDDQQDEDDTKADCRQGKDVNDGDDEDEKCENKDDTESDEEDDDLIPPTPPCANNTIVSSFSKSHVGSKSFLSSSSRQSSSNRGTQSNSGSSSSFSYNSSKSFTFKHPSATHSQRIAKMKSSSQSGLPSDKKVKLETSLQQDDVSESDATRSKRKAKARSASQSVVPSGGKLVSEATSMQKENVSNKQLDKVKIATNEQAPSLEESQSLSIFHNAADSVVDLNAIPEEVEEDSSRKSSSKSKPDAKNEDPHGLSGEEDVAHHREHTYIENAKSKRSKVEGQQRENESDDDELVTCSFLQSEKVRKVIVTKYFILFLFWFGFKQNDLYVSIGFDYLQ